MNNEFPYAYIRKKIVKSKDATVPIQCKAIQYGIGCFSGLRGFWSEEDKNIYIFRMEDHFERLQESAKILGMKLDYTYPKFQKVVMDLIKKNKAKCDIYVRPTLYAGTTALTPRFDNPGDDLAIYMIALKDYFKTDKGLDTCVSSWRRIDDDMISIKAKSTGAYANSALAKTEALQNGYDEPIFLNRNGKACEASGANLFGIKNGILYTPPLGSNVLNGITRRTILELAVNEMGMTLSEEEIDRSSLYTFDELFFSGTAAKITQIRSVDRRVIGNGRPGKYMKKLQAIYDEVALNKNPKYSHWCTPVY